MNQIILDIECYKNYFLVMVQSVQTGKVVAFEQYAQRELQTDKLKAILAASEVITFNGTGYDLPLLSAAVSGASCEALRALSDTIVVENITPWQFYKRHMVLELRLNHIDLIEVAPGIASLKIYGGRLSAPKMQDLPIEPDALITPEQREELKLYCRNDLDVTLRLYKRLEQQINLRRSMSRMYGVDLRSKSDAQIAEAVIVSELTKIRGTKPTKQKIPVGTFFYTPPAFIEFESLDLTHALKQPFVVERNGTVSMPKELEKTKITIGSSTYQMGMGGLHSTEKCVTHESKGGYVLYDWDVASYYPSIILNCELYPKHLGRDFLDVYRAIVIERLSAKKNGDKVKADSLKIVVNGSFGKLGSPYSALYSPDLLVQTTVTGQLSLLMLIEKLERHGLHVVSANTDGIVIKCDVRLEKHMRVIIQWWEEKTGFEMESSEYQSLHSRDVNNYVAVKYNGEVKTKGCFASAGLQKNTANEIAITAVKEYITKQVPLADTIRNCKDVTKFVTIRTVKGGAVKEGYDLGKAVRWYYATGETGYISYKSNGNKVARTDGAKPLMDLPDTLPEDVDYEWYIREAEDMLKGVGK